MRYALQVGQVILTLPNAFATTGMASGVFFQLIFATLALWTLFLLATLYQELKKRKAAWRRDLHHGIVMVQHLCQSITDSLVYILHIFGLPISGLPISGLQVLLTPWSTFCVITSAYHLGHHGPAAMCRALRESNLFESTLLHLAACE